MDDNHIFSNRRIGLRYVHQEAFEAGHPAGTRPPATKLSSFDYFLHIVYFYTHENKCRAG